MRDSNSSPPGTPAVPAAATSVSKRCAACGETYDATQAHLCQEEPTEGLRTLEAALPPPSTWLGPRPGEPEDLVGATLGDRYEMIARLSAGGMGVVYKARHKILNSIVAVKILLKHQDESDQQRFLQEAQLASKINHPNIVYISDYGVLTDGRPYLVMEFLEGPTVNSVLRKAKKHRIDMLRACRIAAQIARGMQSVHDKGIVHRDLKPENIFVLNTDGSDTGAAPSSVSSGAAVPAKVGEDFVKIVDFGIAKDTRSAAVSSEINAALPAQMPVPLPTPAELTPLSSSAISGDRALNSNENLSLSNPSNPSNPSLREPGDETSGGSGAQQALTQIGASLGTPRYMAPEQVDGKGVEGRSDQYALGCILYQMIGGTTPFSAASSMAMLKMHMRDTPRSLRERCPELDVPTSLDGLILRMLRKDKQERFPSMRAVAEALDHEIELLRVKRGEKVALSSGLAALVGGRSGTHVIIRGVKVPLLLAGLSAFLLVAALTAFGVLAYRHFYTEPPGLLPGELDAIEARARQILERALEAPRVELKLGALAALGQTRDGSYRPRLEAALRDADQAVQAQAAEALGQLGDRQAGSALRALLQASSALPLRLAAAQALSQLGDGAGTKLIEGMLSEGNEEAQLRAASLLCQRGNPQAIALLTKAVDENKVAQPLAQRFLACLVQAGSEPARLKLRAQMATPSENALLAAAKLAQIGQEDGRAYLRERILKPGPEQLLAARFLSAPDEPRVAELLRGVLRDPRSGAPARLLAAEGLGICGQLLDVRLLGKQLDRQREPDVMLGAAAAIVMLARNEPGTLSEQSMRWARAALHDSQWAIRESAAAVIGDSKAPDATKLLQGLLADEHPAVRRSAVRALGRRSDEAALMALREGLRDVDGAVRLESLKALLRIAKRVRGARRQGLESGAASWVEGTLQKGSELEQTLARSLLFTLGDRSQLEGLRELSHSTSADVRGQVVQALSRELDVLVEMLKDAVFSVRFGAARQIADAGDKRAVPVLREAVEHKSPEALVSFMLLRKLGETIALPESLIDELGRAALAERQAALEAAEELPSELVLPLLKRLARDVEPSIRKRVAEVAASLPSGPEGMPGLPLLRLLVNDSDASVRARAEALLGPLLSAARDGVEPAPGPMEKPGEKGAGPREIVVPPAAPVDEPPPAGLEAPDGGVSTDGGAGTGTLIVEAPSRVQFQLDKGRWQTASKQPIVLSVGPHELVALSGTQTIEVKEGQSLTLRLSESQIEKMAASGLEALEKKDLRKAQKLLEKANALCGRERRNLQPCNELSVDVNYALGQLFEAQDHLSDAMAAYQRVVAQAGRGREERKNSAQSAMAKLRPSLGQVVIPKREKGKCQEVTLYMVPGTHQVEIDGESQVVKVKAQETVRIGSCK